MRDAVYGFIEITMKKTDVNSYLVKYKGSDFSELDGETTSFQSGIIYAPYMTLLVSKLPRRYKYFPTFCHIWWVVKQKWNIIFDNDCFCPDCKWKGNSAKCESDVESEGWEYPNYNIYECPKCYNWNVYFIKTKLRTPTKINMNFYSKVTFLKCSICGESKCEHLNNK